METLSSSVHIVSLLVPALNPIGNILAWPLTVTPGELMV